MAFCVHPAQLMMNSGGAGSYGHYDRVANPPPHPSLLHAPMPQYWWIKDGRKTVHVPRPQGIDPSHESFPCIAFSTGGWPGVRVKEILRRTAVIDNPTDAIFAHEAWRTTNLALETTAKLDPSRYRLDTLVNGRPITRQEFVQQIAYLVGDVYDRAKGKPVVPGWEFWAFGEHGIRPVDVIIMSAHYYKNVWIPELYVIE